MNKYLIIAVLVLAGLLGLTVVYGYNYVQKTDARWKASEANVKAYSSQLASSNKRNVALMLSVDQLEYFNDSVLTALKKTKEQLNIKDKNLKALQYAASSFAKKDTIILRDTLFKEPTLALDTILGDMWYSLRLGLKYPSTIAVEPYFKSEKHIIVSAEKETVNPPKKFFLLRWFQRKHVVLHIDVVERNPYVDGEASKYVEILK